MRQKTKLFVRFVTLAMLIWGTFFISQFEQSFVSKASQIQSCDEDFRPCWNGCNVNDSTCYANCSSTYVNCLFNHPRPIPEQTLNECQSDKFYSTCVRGGVIGEEYAQYRNTCVAEGGDILDCCLDIKSSYESVYCY